MVIPDGFPRFKDPAPRKPRSQQARNRSYGMVKQRAARKALERTFGQPAARFSGQTGNEEGWRLPARVEVKAGSQVDPIATRYTAAREQSDRNHAAGDGRPFVFVAMPRGVSWGLAVIRLDDLERLLAP